MESVPNYYELLHVQSDAPEPVIKASYRAMMQKMRLHPDLGGDVSTAKLLNEAVSTLCNPETRAAYDQELFTENTSAPGGKPDWNRQSNSADATHREPSDTPDEPKSDSAKKHRKAPPSGTSRENFTYSNLPKRDQCPFCQASYPTLRATGIGYPTDERCAQCKAAATPIEQIDTHSADDVRKIYRHDHQTSASLWTEWPVQSPVEATMTDMSIAGCAVDCVKPMTAGSIVVLDTRLLNGICIVRYCKQNTQAGTFAIGMEFLTLDITSGSGAVFSATA